MSNTPPPLPSRPPPLPEHTRAIGKHPCPECGGNLEWNAAKQALACPYCGTISAWKPQDGDGRPQAEQDLDAALADPANARGWQGERREVQCQSCKAISVFVDSKVAQRCDFCGSPAIIPHESQGDAITPQSLLPFKLSEAQMREKVRAWYGSRWFAPGKLKRAALTDTLKGVYLPYWTFDAHARAHWTAMAGHYYYTTETYRDAQGNTKTRQVRHTRWVPASGTLSHFFDDELVPGTQGLHAPLLRKIEPFPTRKELQSYAPEYVRGWTVERYQVDLRRAATQSREQMDATLRKLCAREVPGDTYSNLQVQASYHGRTFKHILVPVWLIHYTYGRKTYQIVANGHTGTLAGERPYSWVKITFAVLATLLLLAVVLYFFGL